MLHRKIFTVFLRSPASRKPHVLSAYAIFDSQILAKRAFMGIDFSKVVWHQKLVSAGIDENCLSGKGKPCPLCGGKDRFRFDNKGNLGTWWCQHCEAGNGYTLLKAFTGWNSAEVLKFLDDGTVGSTDAPVRAFTFEDQDFSPEKVAKNRERLQRAWAKARPLNGNDPASRYLQKRVPGCDVSKLSRSLRFHPGMTYWDRKDDGKFASLGSFPTLLAQAIDAKLSPITGHRTYLTAAGNKAPFEMVKKQMAGVRKLDGAAIRVVNAPASRVLGVTEGIENAVAVGTAYRYDINVWSLLNCGNLELVDIPAGRFDKIIIFADHDAVDPKKGHRPGEHHAKLLKSRLEAAGYEVELKIPPVEGTDFADLWLQYCDSHQQRRSQLTRAQRQHDKAPAAAIPVPRIPTTTHVMHA
jgi:putative DNA primase/helicase